MPTDRLLAPLRRRDRPAARVLAALAALVSVGSVAIGAPSPVLAKTALEPVLVAQTFELDPSADFSATVSLSSIADGATVTSVEVSVYREVDQPAKVREARAGSLDTAIDSVRIGLGTPSGGATAAVDSSGRIQLRVPTSTAATADDGTLQLPASAVYPIAIELRDDQGDVGRLISFVHRRATEPGRGARLSVGVFLGQTRTPAIDAHGDITLGTDDIDELTRLAASLEAIEPAAGATSDAGASSVAAVQLQPEMFFALENTQPALYQRLVPLLTRTTLVAAPRLPLDPSSAGGQEKLYTTWLQQGSDGLGTRVGGARRERSLVFLGAPVSDAGLSLQRDLGMQVAIVPPDRYDALDGNIGGYGDASQLQSIGLADGTTVHAILLDRDLAADLADATSPPLQSAIDIAAQLLAEVRLIEDLGGSPANHGVLLATADGGAPNAAVLGALLPLLRGSDRMRIVDPADLQAVMTPQLVDGQPTRPLGLPTSAGPDLTKRLQDLSLLRLGEAGVKSMLPDGTAEVAQWDHLLEALASTALTDAQARTLMDGLNAQLDTYRHAIVAPEPFTFTLTGQNSVIRLRLRNTASVPLKVRVQMAAAKMTFPEGDKTVVLAPEASTEVQIKVEARTNGTQGVRLSVLTPFTDTKLVDDVTLKAQVRALTGLGQLLMGAFVLVVLTWWAHHVRTSRRRKRSADSVPRHPAAGGEDLSPDAAASSLSPP